MRLPRALPLLPPRSEASRTKKSASAGPSIVSGSEDRTLKVWDATSGQETLTIKGHTGEVTSVAFSPDGKRIVSGSGDGTLNVWDATSGQETFTLKGHSGAVRGVAFSLDGKRIVSGSYDKTLKLWDDLLSGGAQVVAFGNSDAHAFNLSLGPYKRVVFPYEYTFRCVNTHLLIDEPLTSDVEYDKYLIYSALERGHGWVGYDLLGSTRGFSFKARSASKEHKSQIRNAPPCGEDVVEHSILTANSILFKRSQERLLQSV